jgi:hypothetical protein
MNRVRCIAVLALLLLVGGSINAQTNAPVSEANEAAQSSLTALRRQLQQTQEQLSRSENEIRELRTMMERMQQQVSALAAGKVSPTSDAEASNQEGQQAPVPSPDDWQMLKAEVEEHQQVKVESASKFRLKLSGIVLFNAFSTAGSVDDFNVPEFALPRPPGAPHGTAGATLRQSIIGLTGIGPKIAGARTSADLQMDFFGASASTYSKYSSGIARLRIARMRFDWDKTSLVAGLDVPFFSPNSPTTYLSVAEPAFSASGNLWTWTPTIRIEQRQKLGPTQLKLEAGLIDYSGYGAYSYNANTSRIPTSGESSQQPAYALRVSLNRPSEDNPLAIGVGGIYIPQRFPGGTEVSGWGGTMDLRIPITTRAELTGEFFTGRGINGFGGTTIGVVPTQDFHYAYVTSPYIASLLSLGGWSQFKFKFNSRNEINAAAGYGGFSSSRLRLGSVDDSYLTSLPARNQSMFLNYILRPRSDLIFSLEYRHLRTFKITGSPATADQVGVSAGFLF